MNSGWKKIRQTEGRSSKFQIFFNFWFEDNFLLYCYPELVVGTPSCNCFMQSKEILFDLLGYLASFLTWLSLWLVFCICIDDFETKSSPKNKEDICVIIIVNAIHSLASKPNVFADYGLLSSLLYYVVSTHAATSESQITLSHHYCVWTCAQNRLETLGLMFTLLWCHC